MITLKLALRTLRRFRLYTLINAASLVLSLVCVLSLSRYIYREYTIDSELPDHDRVFFTVYDQVVTDKNLPPQKIRSYYQPDFNATKSSESNLFVINDKIIGKCALSGPDHTDEIQLEEGKSRLAPLKLLYADSTFFDLMQYKVLHGTLQLKGENDALIMSDVAERIFGTTHVVGKKWITKENKRMTVVGVIQRPRCKTTFDFDLMYRLQSKKHGSRGLVKLYQPQDSTLLNNLLNEVFENELKNINENGAFVRSHLLSLEAHQNIYRNDSKQLHLYIVMVVIFFIIGAFNYLNLHSVILYRRKRDLQIKTIFGANKKKIFSELFMEHFLILTAILPFIWLLVYLARNPLNELFNIPLESDIHFDIALTLTIPLVLGMCFALFSYFQIQHQTLDTSETSAVPAARRSSYARIAFLFVQYMMTFCLIVFALYLNYHVYYIFNSNRGYRTDHVLYFNINSGSSQTGEDGIPYFVKDYETIIRKRQLAREFERNIAASPLFDGVTFGERPYDLYLDNEFITDDGKNITSASHHATPEWMEFFQLPFLHGQNWTKIEQTQVGGGFNEDIPLSPDDTYKVIVNETFWKILNPKQQKEAFHMNTTANFYPNDKKMKVEIVGVIPDFSLVKLTNKPQPLIFYLESERGCHSKLLFAAVKPGKEEEAIDYLAKLHHRLCPEGSFECKWLDDDLYERHKDDFNAVKSVSVFAIIAILISCLGLFGISLYDIRGRYKEIALRKINGAHNKDIYRILLRKYALALIGASLAATPFVYWGITEYMQKVDNRAPLTVWIFLAAFLILAFVSLLTLFVQLYRAVHINAAEVMKTE